MKKRLKEEMGHVYTLFWDREIEVESYPVQMVLNHMLKGLLHCRVYTLDQKQIWSCEHTGKISLEEYIQNRELKKEEVQWICMGILENLQEAQEFLLNTNCLYLKPADIYLDISEKRVWNSYVPFYSGPVWTHIQELIQYLLGCLKQEDSETVQMLYGIYRYLSQGGTDIDKIWQMLCDEKKSFASIPQKEECEKNPIENKIRKQQGKYSYVHWIVTALPIALAVFICVFVTYNEWYLSNQQKLLLLIMAGILYGAGVALWKLWKGSLQKVNPLDQTEKAKKNDV